jgi:hypothetical protein
MFNIYDPMKFLMASSNASLVMVNKPTDKVTFTRLCFLALRFHENITLNEITYFSKVEQFQGPEVSGASVYPNSTVRVTASLYKM